MRYAFTWFTVVVAAYVLLYLSSLAVSASFVLSRLPEVHGLVRAGAESTAHLVPSRPWDPSENTGHRVSQSVNAVSDFRDSKRIDGDPVPPWQSFWKSVNGSQRAIIFCLLIISGSVSLLIINLFSWPRIRDRDNKAILFVFLILTTILLGNLTKNYLIEIFAQFASVSFLIIWIFHVVISTSPPALAARHFKKIFFCIAVSICTLPIAIVLSALYWPIVSYWIYAEYWILANEQRVAWIQTNSYRDGFAAGGRQGATGYAIAFGLWLINAAVGVWVSRFLYNKNIFRCTQGGEGKIEQEVFASRCLYCDYPLSESISVCSECGSDSNEISKIQYAAWPFLTIVPSPGRIWLARLLFGLSVLLLLCFPLVAGTIRALFG